MCVREIDSDRERETETETETERERQRDTERDTERQRDIYIFMCFLCKCIYTCVLYIHVYVWIVTCRLCIIVACIWQEHYNCGTWLKTMKEPTNQPNGQPTPKHPVPSHQTIWLTTTNPNELQPTSNPQPVPNHEPTTKKLPANPPNRWPAENQPTNKEISCMLQCYYLRIP